jgi:hypothetical protein
VTAPIDRAKQGRANRNRGATAERRVATYLRDNGFPGAERAIRSGWVGQTRQIADQGDITGTPGIVWQVKDCQRENIRGWLAETEQQRHAANAVMGLLVVRQRGAANPGRWWCWLDLGTLFDFVGAATWAGVGRQLEREPVRLELGPAVELLRIRGYGDPVVTE